MNITVNDILGLMINSSFELNFFIHDKTFRFNNDEIPEELLYMTVGSIDDPAYQSEGTPLTINLSEEDFDNFPAFAEEFDSYLV